MADLRIENHGSIVMLRPVSDLGREWVAEHIPQDAIWFGGAVAVEPRYLGNIIDGAAGDGLEIEGV